MKVTNIPIDNLTVHPAAALMPELSGDQWKRFVEDVRANGVREAITVQDGVILDGRQRWKAARECGLKTIPARLVSQSESEQTIFILEACSLRQHLNDDQRAIAGARIRKVLSKQMKAERASKAGKAGGRGRSGIASGDTSAASRQDGSREIVARKLGLSRSALERAIKLDEEAPDLADQVLSGRLALRLACRQMRSRQRQKELMEKSKSTSASDRYRLIVGDCFKVEIEPESIDAIITDPPYGKGIVERCEKLAELGSKALKPGGSLLAMTGQLQFPEILKAMSRHLRYYWQVAYLMPGGSTPLFNLGVNPHWKAIVWFSKGEPAISRIVNDVCRSNRYEKPLHDWQQSESGFLELVEQFSEPDSLVLDPFCGSGTTGVACLKLGRRFLGIDKDKRSIKISAGRFASLKSEV